VCLLTTTVGGIIAWFTDSVTSENNKIQAGNPDIALLMHNGDSYVDISESTDPIFGTGSIAQNNNAQTLWEPGKTQVAYLAIENKGNLAVKYQVNLNVENVAKNLYEVMEYAIVPDAQAGGVNSWTSGQTAVIGEQTAATDVSLAVGATHYFALAIHMAEAAGNEYQNGAVNFDMTIVATQDTVESDSFNNQYDAEATYDNAINVKNVAELLAAISNASEDAANPTLINIANSFEVSEDIQIPAGKYVEINGNGKTISRADDSTANPVIRIEGNANITNLTVDAKADATHASRAVYITADADAVLTNCTITGAYNTGYGGAMQVYGNVTLDNCKISGNTAKVGAGVNVASGGTLNVKNTTINGNTNTSTGGNSIQAANATVNISNSTLADDNALYLHPGYAPLTYTISGDIAIDNIHLSHGNGSIGQSVPEIFVTSALEKDLVFYVYEPGAPIISRTLLKGANGYTLTDADLAHVKVYFKDNVTTEYTLYDASNETYKLVVQDNRIEFVQK